MRVSVCIYLLSGKIYRWLARGKIMAIFAKSFLMSSKNHAECQPQNVIKEKLSPRSRRYQLEGVELRAYPDPTKNIDDADKNVKMFDDPKLIQKWISRAHGNNEMSSRIGRSFLTSPPRGLYLCFMNIQASNQK